MRIVFTSDLSGLGGGETGIAYLAEELISKGHSCLVVCREDGPFVTLLIERKVPMVVLNYKDKGRPLVSLAKLRKVISEFEADVVLNNDPTTSLISFVSSFGLSISTYWIAHGQWYEFGKAKKTLLKFCNRKVLCVSEAVRRSLIEQGFARTATVYLGVPTEQFRNASPVGFRNQLGIEKSVPLIITVARFQKIKGQIKALRAAKMLKESGDCFCYAFIGGSAFGSEEDEAYRRKALQFAKEEGLFGKEVRFVGERKDIAGIMREADLLVIPSDNESLGVVALEALSSRLPIISTPNDGVKEVLRNNTLCIAETNDEKGLYKLVHAFLQDESAAETILAETEGYGARYQVDAVANGFIKALDV